MILPEALAGLAFSIREYEPDDRNFVIAKWQEALGDGDIAPYSRMKKHDFMRNMARRAEELARRGSRVACNAERRDQIYGFAIGEPGDTPVVHMVYVKPQYRRIGIAHVLLESLLPSCERYEFSYWPTDSGIFDGFAGAVFNPFRA